jgi:hypothetical protein
MATLTTTAIYNGTFVIPKVKPDFSPEEVTVTFKARARDTDDEVKEARRKALRELAGCLDITRHPELKDPIAYVRRMRDLELADDRGYKHLHRTRKQDV